MTGFGTLAIVGLQAAAAFSVVVFFRRRHDPRLWSTLIAPALGGAGLLTAFILAIVNFRTLAGSDSDIIALLPWLILIVRRARLRRRAVAQGQQARGLRRPRARRAGGA